jgi:hypothetical protein
MIERVGAELRLSSNLLKFGSINYLESQAEPVSHLGSPLLKKRARWRDDQHPLHQPSGHQLGHDESGLNGLTQADAIRQEQSHPAHGQCSDDRNELIGLNLEAPWLDGEKRVRAEGLFENEGLVVQEPFPQPTGFFGVDIVPNRLDLVQSVKEFDLLTGNRSAEPAQPIHGAAVLLIAGDQLPSQSSCLYLGARKQVVHAGLG